MVCFELGKEIEKYVFRLVTSVGQIKKNRDKTKNILLCLQHLIFKESAELRTSFRVSQTVIFI